MRDKDKGICRIVAILIVVTIGTSCVLPLIGNATGQGTWEKIWGPAGTVVDCNSSAEFVPADQRFLVYATNRSTGDIYEYKYESVVATMQWTKLPEMPLPPTIRLREEWPPSMPRSWYILHPEEEREPYGGPRIACDRFKMYAKYPGADVIYMYSDGEWYNLGGPANMTSICAGDNGSCLLYATNKSGIYRLVYDMSQSPQSQWEKIGDWPGEIAAGSGPTDPKLYVTYPDSAGVFRFGILGLYYPGLWTYGLSFWTYIGGPLPTARIYAGGHELFATNYDNDTGDIYHYTFVPPQPHNLHYAPGVWTKLPYMSPPPEEEPYEPKFAVDDEGVLFGLDKTGVYRWDSTSKQWTKIGEPKADIYANIHGRLYATDLVTHDLWCWS